MICNTERNWNLKFKHRCRHTFALCSNSVQLKNILFCPFLPELLWLPSLTIRKRIFTYRQRHDWRFVLFFFLTSLANWRGEELWKLMQIKIANWEFCLSTGLIAWKGSSVSDSGQHQQINGYWDLNTSRMSQTALKCPYLQEINLAIQGFLLCLIERREGERGWEEGKG